MTKHNNRAALTLILLLALNTLLLGDVTKQSTTKMEFKGTAGTMMKFLGVGKPSHSTEYLKGNKLRTDELDKKGKKAEESRIIDLDEEVFITLNHKKKKFSKMTFAQWREMMEQNMEKLEGLNTEDNDPGSSDTESDTDVKWDFSVDISTPGETKKIAGYEAEKVLMTMNMEAEATEKNKNEEDKPEKAKGGMVVKSTHWMVRELSGDEEYRAFYLKFAEKLGFDMKSGSLGDAIGQIMQNNQQLAAAMKEMQEQREAMEGTPMEVHTIYETWGESSNQQQSEQPEMSIPTSLGGLFGKKKKEEPKKESGSNVLMEMRTETTKYNTDLIDPALYQIPAKYNEEKPKY